MNSGFKSVRFTARETRRSLTPVTRSRSQGGTLLRDPLELPDRRRHTRHRRTRSATRTRTQTNPQPAVVFPQVFPNLANPNLNIMQQPPQAPPQAPPQPPPQPPPQAPPIILFTLKFCIFLQPLSPLNVQPLFQGFRLIQDNHI